MEWLGGGGRCKPGAAGSLCFLSHCQGHGERQVGTMKLQLPARHPGAPHLAEQATWTTFCLLTHVHSRFSDVTRTIRLTSGI